MSSKTELVTLSSPKNAWNFVTGTSASAGCTWHVAVSGLNVQHTHEGGGREGEGVGHCDNIRIQCAQTGVTGPLPSKKLK